MGGFMKKVKTFLVLIVLCLLCGCQNTNKVPTIEKVGEVVVLQDNLLYVSPSDKLGSYDFELDDVSLIDGYKLGDIVKIKFYAEEKEDKTGKKYNIYHLVSIEPASGFYEDGITLNDLIDFDVNEIIVQYDNNEYLIDIYDDGARELLSKWSDIKIYKDYIPGFFKNNESFDNFDQIFQEYNDAYASKKKAVDDLFSEIKKIKKLKV